MSAARSSGHLVKRLVAVVDEMPGDGLDEHPQEPFDLPNFWGIPPADGDPVGLPTPCARARAGYFCMCLGQFSSLRGEIPMTRARVEMAAVGPEDAGDVPFVDGPPSKAEVPDPTDQDRDVLRQMLDALPAGTIVERKGLGFAPLYRPRKDRTPGLTLGARR